MSTYILNPSALQEDLTDEHTFPSSVNVFCALYIRSSPMQTTHALLYSPIVQIVFAESIISYIYREKVELFRDTQINTVTIECVVYEWCVL